MIVIRKSSREEHSDQNVVLVSYKHLGVPVVFRIGNLIWLHCAKTVANIIGINYIITCTIVSMITVVGFRAKQATGSRYMPSDKLYANYFFIRIDLDSLEPAKNWAQFQK